MAKELSDEKNIFQIRSQNQLIFAKTLICQKKLRHFEILKNFFHGSMVYGLKLHTSKFSTQKPSHNLFKSDFFWEISVFGDIR